MAGKNVGNPQLFVVGRKSQIFFIPSAIASKRSVFCCCFPLYYFHCCNVAAFFELTKKQCDSLNPFIIWNEANMSHFDNKVWLVRYEEFTGVAEGSIVIKKMKQAKNKKEIYCLNSDVGSLRDQMWSDLL